MGTTATTTVNIYIYMGKVIIINEPLIFYAVKFITIRQLIRCKIDSADLNKTAMTVPAS